MDWEQKDLPLKYLKWHINPKHNYKQIKVLILNKFGKKMEKILVICAHPDDETLGMGGTLALHAKKGDEIFVLVFTEGESGADNVPHDRIAKRQRQGEKACSILGVKKTKFLNYADQKLDDFPLLNLAKEIEVVIKKWKPTIVYTHFGGGYESRS